MKKNLVLALLAGSTLAGCGQTATTPKLTAQATTSVQAMSLDGIRSALIRYATETHKAVATCTDSLGRSCVDLSRFNNPMWQFPILQVTGKSMDVNHDGLISLSEIVDGFSSNYAVRQFQQVIRSSYRSIDKNGDEFVDKEELKAGKFGNKDFILPEDLSDWDKDRDSKLSGSEFEDMLINVVVNNTRPGKTIEAGDF